MLCCYLSMWLGSLVGNVWNSLEMSPVEASLEFCKLTLMGDSDQRPEDQPQQASFWNKDCIGCWTSGHMCYASKKKIV